MSRFASTIRSQSLQTVNDYEYKIIDDSKVVELARSTSIFQRIYHPTKLAIKFSDKTDELNSLAILCLLSFSEKYTREVEISVGRSIFDTACRAILSSNLGCNGLLTTEDMIKLSDVDLSELFGVEIYQERKHTELPGLVIGEVGGHVFDYVQSVRKMINYIGGVLRSVGIASFGIWLNRIISCDSDDFDSVLCKIKSVFPEVFQNANLAGYNRIISISRLLKSIYPDNLPNLELPIISPQMIDKLTNLEVIKFKDDTMTDDLLIASCILACDSIAAGASEEDGKRDVSVYDVECWLEGG